MGTSILILFIVMFLIFMFSSKKISDSSKTVSFVLGLILIAYVLINVIKR